MILLILYDLRSFVSLMSTYFFNQMKFKTLILLTFLLLVSCIKELDYRLSDVPPKLVVNSVLQANHPVVVNVSGLQSILDTSFVFIENALVILNETGGQTDTLRFQSGGDYRSKISAIPGRIYHLTVEAENYPTVYACDTVPFVTEITHATLEESTTIDEFGDYHNDFTVTFEKQSGKINYYELFFIEQFKKNDSCWNIYFEALAESIDPVVESSGTTNYNFYTYLFNDAGMSTDGYTIYMKMMNGFTGGGTFSSPVVPLINNLHGAVLRTVSKSYYEYRASWGKHQFFKNDSSKIDDWIYIPLIGEPQDMFSNIENGLGIFVAYTQDFYPLN